MKNINKKLRILLAATIFSVSALGLSACTNTSNVQKGNSSEVGTKGSETSEDSSKEEVSGANQNGSSGESKTADTSKKEDSSTSKQTRITYYTYDINTEKLTEHTKDVNDLSVGNIIKELVKNNVLQEGTEVKSAKVETIDNKRTMVVDVNQKFVNFDQGASAENLSLQAFTNSVVKTFNVERVKLTVEGKNYSGGHIALNDGEYLTYK